LEKSGAQALCFDHINPDRYIAEIFLRAATEKSIPTLALPHGVFIYTNNFVRTGSAEEDRYDKFNRFDYIITQNELRKEVLVRAGVNREKIFVLGSARYCNEWMTQNKEILPRTMNSNPETPGRLKAVFMTTRFAYRIDVERMLKTFELLSELEGLEMVVKPHTRTGKEAKVYQNIPLTNVAEFSSVELCEWADVVLVIGSSIIIEPLKQGKPVLYLKYLHENTTQYEELGACWTIHDETELKDALLSLQDNKMQVPYTSKNADRFLSEIIYGGQRKRDVLGDYEKFIVNSVEKRN
jgi:3-deoxy-D-manno-octulosonic-acid transferase